MRITGRFCSAFQLERFSLENVPRNWGGKGRFTVRGIPFRLFAGRLFFVAMLTVLTFFATPNTLYAYLNTHIRSPDMYWLGGDPNWLKGSFNWQQTIYAGEESDSGAFPTSWSDKGLNNQATGMYAHFKYIVPKSFYIQVNGDVPNLSSIDIDNGSSYQNWLFEATEGLTHSLIGRNKKSLTISPYGTDPATRSVTFDHVTLNNFKKFKQSGGQVFFTGGSIVDMQELSVSNGGEFSWDGGPSPKNPLYSPHLATSLVTLSSDSSLSLLNLQPKSVSITLINGKGDSRLTLSTMGTAPQTLTGLGLGQIVAGSLSLAGGHLALSPIVSVPRLSVSQGATLEMPTMGRGFDSIDVNGALLVDTDTLVTSELSGAGEVRLGRYATLSGAAITKDSSGKLHSSHEWFTGTINLNGQNVTVKSALDLGNAKTILGGGRLEITTPANADWGGFVLPSAFSNSGSKNLVLELHGDPLTLKPGAPSSGPGLYKQGAAELVLSGGVYDYGEMRVMAGRMTLTDDAELTAKSGLYVYNTSYDASSALKVSGSAVINGKIVVDDASLILESGTLRVNGDAELLRNTRNPATFLYQGGMLATNGLDLGTAVFKADLLHSGVFVVADYRSLTSEFSNTQDLLSSITIGGQAATSATLKYGSGTDDYIVLETHNGMSMLYRAASSGSTAWRAGGYGWQREYANPASTVAWTSDSQIAVFGAHGVTPYTVQVQGRVEADMLSFLNEAWKLLPQDANSVIVLKPFADEPGHPFHHAVLNSQVSGPNAPECAVPILVPSVDVPIWKTGPGDLRLTGNVSGSFGGAQTPQNVIIKDGRLILGSRYAFGSGVWYPRFTIEESGTLVMDIGYETVANYIDGPGKLELLSGDTIFNQSNPGFTGPVGVAGGLTVTVEAADALGTGTKNDITLGAGASLALGYNRADVFTRGITGPGQVSVMESRQAALASGNSYTGGTMLEKSSRLRLEGPGAGRVFSAAGTGPISMNVSANLELTGGGILGNAVRRLAPTLLNRDPAITLDNNAYTLLDNNLRRDDSGALDIPVTTNWGTELTLQADSAKGLYVTPEFTVSGSGSLILDAPGVLFGNLKGVHTGGTTLTDKTLLRLADDPDSQIGSGPVRLSGDDSVLVLGMHSDTQFRQTIQGSGSVRLNDQTYTFSADNSDFYGRFEVNGGVLQVDNQSQIGSAGLILNRGTLNVASSMSLDNAVTLESGGGTVDAAGELTLTSGLDGSGGLSKTGDGTLILTGASNGYAGSTVVDSGELRLKVTALSATSAVTVGKDGTLAGHGAVAGNTVMHGKLSVEGDFAFGGSLAMQSGSSLAFSNGGALETAGALTWADQARIADITLDSLGVYVLADYGSTNLGAGIVDPSRYGVVYNGASLVSGSQYRQEMLNYAAQNKLMLISLPNGHTMSFWEGAFGSLWEKDGPANWNTNYVPSVQTREAWTDVSRVAVFGVAGGIPGNVTVAGKISASGLFFPDSGWTLNDGSIELLDLDPDDAGAFAVLGAQGYAVINSALTGVAGLHKSGAGTLRLDAVNTYAGNTLVSSGVLELGDARAAGSGASIDVAEGAVLRLAYGSASTALRQRISGDGALEIYSGARLDTANSFTGGTRLYGSELSLGHSRALGAGPLTINNGMLSLDTGLNVGNGIILESNFGAIRLDSGATGTLSGRITGFGGLLKTGDGELVLGNAQNDYGGSTIVARGVLTGEIASGTELSLARGTIYNGGGKARSIRTLDGGGVIADTAGLTVQSGIFDGVIDNSNSGGLTKTGDDTLTLSGDNSYAGATRVEDGELRLDGGALSGTSGVTVADGGVLAGRGAVAGNTVVRGKLSLEGNFTVSGDVALRSGASLAFSSGGHLEATGALTWADPDHIADITLDSLGVYVLADYGGTNLGAGIMDSERYDVIYKGVSIANGLEYRQELINDDARNRLLLITLPNAHKVSFWEGASGNTWEKNGPANWNTDYIPSAQTRETWTDDSRVAVFGASGVAPGAIALTGKVSASGLYFLDSGWTVSGGSIELLDLDTGAAGAFAVLGVQGDTAVNSVLTGNAGLHKSGAATLRLGAANTYAGNTLVSAGVLELGNAAAAGSGRTITVEEDATLRLAYDDNQTALAQAIAGNGAVIVTGNVLLDKASTLTGAMRVEEGHGLDIAHSQALGLSTLTLDGGALGLGANVSVSNDIVLQFRANTPNTVALISGESAAITESVTGQGDLVITSRGSVSRTLDFSGYADINGGITVTQDAALRLNDGWLSIADGLTVEPGAVLSGNGGMDGNAAVQGVLDVSGYLVVNGDVTLHQDSSLLFDNGGRLETTGALTWIDPSHIADITLDSLGVYVLADYGDTNLGAGLVDPSRYGVTYNGDTIVNGPEYRQELFNYGARNKLVLISLPNDHKVTFWEGAYGDTWEKDGPANWSTNYLPTVESREAWTDVSRVAVFGAAGALPGKVTVTGEVAASGLFFLDSGWSIDGGSIKLLDLDADAAGAFAVLGSQTGSSIISAVLTGGAGLHKIGAGSILLNAANTYAGGTLVSAGVLELGDVSAAGGGGSITVEEDATLRLGYDNGQNALPQTITGRGDVAITGDVLLDKPNSHQGGTRLSGVLRLADAGALGQGALRFNNGALVPADSLTVTNDMTLAGDANQIAVADADTLELTGALSGTGGLVKASQGALLLSGLSSYSGGTSVVAGTLIAGSDSAMGSGVIDMAAGTVLGFSGSRTLSNDFVLHGDPIFDVAGGADSALTGVISGTAGFVKTGGGTLTLTGENDYTGMTTVAQGALALADGGRISDQLTLWYNTAFDAGGYSDPLAQLTVHRRAAYTGDLNTEGGAMRFIIPADASFDDLAMLDVAGTASIEGSSVSFDIGDRDLNPTPGQRITLIRASGDLAGEPLNSVITGRIGITIGYDVGLDSDEHTLYASVLRVGASEESKALSTGYLAGLALLNQGGDLVAGQGMAEAAAVSRRAAGLEKSDRGLAAFGVLAGSRSRYETGSHLDMDSLSVMTGLAWSRAWSRPRDAGYAPVWTTLGAFFEYGNGSYDTYNSFSGLGGFDGNGDVSYMGGGLLARVDAKIPAAEKTKAGAPADTLYLEASGRAGRVKNEYANSDLRDHATGRKGDYDSSSLYYGAHVGAGYIREIDGAGSLDMYSKFFWTRQEGDTVSLDNGQKVNFKDADSYRLRAGARYSFGLGERVGPYIGAAWEYEFSGKSRASANGYGIDAPTLKGGSAMGEVGLSVKPAADLPLYLNLGAQGYFGSREGVAGTLQIKFEF